MLDIKVHYEKYKTCIKTNCKNLGITLFSPFFELFNTFSGTCFWEGSLTQSREYQYEQCKMYESWHNQKIGPIASKVSKVNLKWERQWSGSKKLGIKSWARNSYGFWIKKYQLTYLSRGGDQVEFFNKLIFLIKSGSEKLYEYSLEKWNFYWICPSINNRLTSSTLQQRTAMQMFYWKFFEVFRTSILTETSDS